MTIGRALYRFLICWLGLFLSPGLLTAQEAQNMNVYAADTRFGLDLYNLVVRAGAGPNVFISPTSITLCLSMAYNGAAGETAEAMARALRIQGIPLDGVNKAYSDWMKSLNQPGTQVEIEIANSMWARRGISFLPAFIDANRTAYGAEFADLDFGNPASVSRINDWVNKKTRGKIDKIIDRISSDSVLFLINAIYFKGKWTRQFDKNATKIGNFTNSNGSATQRPMMHQSGTFRYFENAAFQTIALPYGNGKFGMYIFLPAKNSSLSDFQKELTAENWKSWISQYEEAEGSLTLPRFRIEYETELNEPLKQLGMATAFDPQRADFSKMIQSSRNAAISKVKHKAFADVNEEGTEAAAATSTEITLTSMRMPTRKFQMVVDRPFFFAICDNKTGALLFLGSVGNPA